MPRGPIFLRSVGRSVGRLGKNVCAWLRMVVREEEKKSWGHQGKQMEALQGTPTTKKQHATSSFVSESAHLFHCQGACLEHEVIDAELGTTGSQRRVKLLPQLLCEGEVDVHSQVVMRHGRLRFRELRSDHLSDVAYVCVSE